MTDTTPETSAFTRRLYDRLPETYREADAVEPTGGGTPLLRYLSLIGDQAGALDRLADRVNYTPPDEGGPAGDTSDLADPATADDVWLEWLAQASGTRLPVNGPGPVIATNLSTDPRFTRTRPIPQPDPARPGIYFIDDEHLTPDPARPGIYLIGQP